MKNLLYILLAVTLFTACSSDDDDNDDVRTVLSFLSKEKDSSGNLSSLKNTTHLFESGENEFSNTQDISDYMMGRAKTKNGKIVSSKYSFSTGNNSNIEKYTKEGKYFAVTYINDDNERFRYTTYYINVKHGMSKSYTITFNANARFYMESNSENIIESNLFD